MTTALSRSSDNGPLWGRSVAWLLCLGPFFFMSYGFSNHYAASRGVEMTVHFDWERHIPFVPWTIVPYWSIDLFYGLSFLCCRSPRQVDRHALRLLSAQIISVACFLAFPLRFAFLRPSVDGFFGNLFDALMGFDLPYNQVPSLHISLLVIIWARFAVSVGGVWRGVVHLWAVLIGLSVLTTYQHHFIDIPTGAAAGLLCLWLWPAEGRWMVGGLRQWPTARRWHLATGYALTALGSAAVVLKLGGIALWGGWLSLALLMVALIYLGGDAAGGFQKREGKHPLAVRVLLAPYRVCARLNAWLWTRPVPQPSFIADGVWLGRHPGEAEFSMAIPGGFSALVDCCPELAAPSGVRHCISLPWLDLVVPNMAQLETAAREIGAARSHGPLLVCCALGYSRSACAVVAWLYRSGRCAGVDEAVALVRRCRTKVVLGEAHLQALRALETHQ